jgi:hypothetical protein
MVMELSFDRALDDPGLEAIIVIAKGYIRIRCHSNEEAAITL